MDDDRIALLGRRYTSCRTYEDRGTVFLDGALHGRFATRFVRDGAVLEFQYEEVDGKQYSLTSRAGRCTMQLPPALADVEVGFPVDTPTLCIAGLAGVTLGASVHAPRLLMPELEEFPSVLATGTLAPTQVEADAHALAYVVPTYGGRSVAIFDARTLLLCAVGDSEDGIRDWTKFAWVVLYEDISMSA